MDTTFPSLEENDETLQGLLATSARSLDALVEDEAATSSEITAALAQACANGVSSTDARVVALFRRMDTDDRVTLIRQREERQLWAYEVLQASFA